MKNTINRPRVPDPYGLNFCARQWHRHGARWAGRGGAALLLTMLAWATVPGALGGNDTWAGTGTNPLWSNRTNWGGTAPVNGDSIIFAGGSQKLNTNDILFLNLNTIFYTGSGWTNAPLTNGPGYTITLANGISDSAGNNTNNIPLILGASQTFANSAPGTTNQVGGSLFLSNYNLTIAGMGVMNFTGVISGSNTTGLNSVTMTGDGVGNGVLRLSGANTFNGGVNINAGTVQVGNAAAIPNGAGKGNVTVGTSGTLDLFNNSVTMNGLNGSGIVDQLTSNTGNYTLSLGGGNSNGTFSGLIENTFGTISLVKNGTGTQFFTGNGNTFTGSVTVNGGVLNVGTYFGSTGPTVVNAGSFVISSGGTINSTNITLRPGGVWDFSATPAFSLSGSLIAGRPTGFSNDVIGNLTMAGGSILLVGQGLAGTMQVNGNLTLQGTTLSYDLSSTTTPGGGTNDLITLTGGGSLNLAGGTTLVKVNPIAGSLNGTYTLISGSSTPIVGSLANVQLATIPRGLTATFDLTSQPTNLLLVASGTAAPASLVWAGNGAGGNWDVQTSQVWSNNGVLDVYYDLDNVIFNDTAGTANASITLPGPVTPGSITVSNTSAVTYNIGGSNDLGQITGNTGLTLNGTGLVTLNAANNFTGNVTVNRGILGIGDVTASTPDTVLWNGVTPGALSLAAGGLYLGEIANTTELLTISNFVLNPGGSTVVWRARQANCIPSFQINSVTRNVGSTVDFNNIQVRAGSHVGIYFNSNTVPPVKGMLGGYASWGLNDWAVPTNAGNGSFNLANYQTNANPTNWVDTNNVSLTLNTTTSVSNKTINSLKLQTATVTVGAGQTLSISSGGILIPTAGATTAINGGTLLGATNADLVVLENATGGALTIGSVIADNTNGLGAQGSVLTKGGQGTLILTGNNTYTGPTYINGITYNGTTVAGGVPATIPAGVLQIGNGGTSGSINSQNIYNNATLTFNRSDAMTIANLISGFGGIRQLGSGTTILAANNSYTGVTTISAGTLQVGDNGSFSNSVSVLDNGTLAYSGTGSSGYAGPITGSGSLNVAGGGTFVLGGTASYTGNTTVSGGALSLAATGSISNSALITVAAGANLNVTASGGITLNGGVIAQELAGSGSVTGPVTSGLGTTLSPGGDGVIGTLTLNSGLTLNGGSVNIDVNGSSRDLLAVTGNLNLASGTIVLNNQGAPLADGAYRLITYSGTLTGNALNLALAGFSQPGQLASLSSAIPGEIDMFVATGVGNSLTWLGDGAGNVWNTGTANFTNSGGVPALFANNDLVRFTDAGAVHSPVTLAGVLSPGSLTVASSGNYTFQGSGKIAGGASVILNGPANATILTTNTYSGPTTINAGTLTLGDGTTDGALGNGAVTNKAALVFNEAGNELEFGAMSGTGSLTVTGTGSVTLRGNNGNFSGPVTISSGTLQVGSGGSTGTSGTGPITNNSALVFNRSGNITNVGVITGSGAVSNLGAGTLYMNTSNTYTGNTVIANGIVKVGVPGAIPGGTNFGNVVLDGGAVAGVLDMNGFNLDINGLSGVNGTVLGQIVNNSGAVTNKLIIGDNDFLSSSFSGSIKDNSGSGGKIQVIKIGAGTNNFDVPNQVGNTYTGGTILSNGVLSATSPGGSNPLNLSASSVAFGSGPITFFGGTLSVAGSVGQNTTPTWNAYAPTIIIPTNQFGTINGCQRGAVNPVATGGGTLTFWTAYVRGQLGGNFSGFTGSLIIQGNANGGNLGLVSTNGFPNARVQLTNGGNSVLLYDLVAGTPNIPFGELTGDAASQLVAASSGNAGGLAANYMVGGLNTSTNFDGSVIDTVGLVKVGTGTWTLTSPTITYSGLTAVSNGVMVFTGAVPGTSTSYTLAAPGILDISAPGLGLLSVGSIPPQTLRGNGTLRGSLTVGPAGTLLVGFTNAIGTLTVTNVVDLSGSGTNFMELNRTNVAGGTCDQIAATNIVLGGTLTVSNIGPRLLVGDTFKLFNTPALSGTFVVVNLPATDAGSNTYTWQDRTAIDGTIKVLTSVPPINLTPTNIISAVIPGGPTGLQIQLTWPTDRIGWRLQMQSNTLTVGLLTNAWLDVVGSTSTNQVIFPIANTNETFFRMVYP